MSDSHQSDHAANPSDLFPPAEWKAFNDADTKAATVIVTLLLGIFVTGIVLYSIVLATL